MQPTGDAATFKNDLIEVGALLVGDRTWLTDEEVLTLSPLLERLLKTKLPLTDAERRRVAWIRREVDFRQGPHYVGGGLPGSGR